MNVVVVTQNAPLYLATFLDDLFARLRATPHTVVGVAAFSATFSHSFAQEVRTRLGYYGPAAFLNMSARIAVEQVLARCARVWPGLGCHSVANVLRKYGVPRIVAPSVNTPAFLDAISDGDVDVILSVASPKIFKAPALAAPRLACLNYHTGLLPRYRGRQPLFWALLGDESEVGITVHEMDERLDNGPIVAQTTVPVAQTDTLHTLYQKTIAAGPALVVTALDRVATGFTERLPNDAAQATYFSFPTPAEAARFRAAGKRFV